MTETDTVSRLDDKRLERLVAEHATPLFVYDMNALRRRAALLVSLQLPYGFVPRYAVKANNHAEVVGLLDQTGLHFDASSSYEAAELLSLAVPGEKISLSSQQPAHNLDALLRAGVHYVATSLHQLDLFLSETNRPDTVGLRVNPGLGAGHNNRTTTGGANSSFGLWGDYVPQALQAAAAEGVTINRLHMHIGSGADPNMWGKVMDTALGYVEAMPDVTSLDIGGGFKVHRYGDEHEADMASIVAIFSEKLRTFASKTGREIRLEVEPGTWLVAHAGTLIASVVDIVDTGADGHRFLRLDTGMNDIIRPSMYGAQHTIEVLSTETERVEYVVVGHNCETGDILTPAPGDPEGLEPRRLKKAVIGDLVAIYDVGAYCRDFAVGGYNSFPSADEVCVD